MPVLLAALAAINAIVFAAFAIDKASAVRARRRIPEARLLMLAALGGTPGAYAARALFRHKTRKQPFSARLHAIAIMQTVALCALGGWLLAG